MGLPNACAKRIAPTSFQLFLISFPAELSCLARSEFSVSCIGSLIGAMYIGFLVGGIYGYLVGRRYLLSSSS